MDSQAKAEWQKRLTAIGLFDEFRDQKESLRRSKRDEGASRETANHDAWQEAIKEFEPRLQELEKEKAVLDAEDESSVTGESRIPGVDESCWSEEELSEAFHTDTSQKGLTFAEEVRWAYERYCDPSVRPADCPSPGSLTLLSFARNSQAKFVDLAAKVLPQANAPSKPRSCDSMSERDELKLLQLNALLGGFNPDTQHELSDRVTYAVGIVLDHWGPTQERKVSDSDREELAEKLVRVVRSHASEQSALKAENAK